MNADTPEEVAAQRAISTSPKAHAPIRQWCLLRIAQAAELCDVPVKRIRSAIGRGDLPVIQMGSRSFRIEAGDLEAWRERKRKFFGQPGSRGNNWAQLGTSSDAEGTRQPDVSDA